MRKKTRFRSSSYLALTAALFFLAVPTEAQALPQNTEKVTRANWRKHPEIEAVRAIVRSVNESWEKREFKTSERNLENCEDTFTQFRRLTVDSKDVVRRYEVRYTSEDEGRTDQYYYDENGRLRFVVIEASAGNGSRLRHRIYVDEKGKRVWEEHHVTGGPGHFWPRKWPDSELHRTDAARAFAKTDGCKEIKPKTKRK